MAEWHSPLVTYLDELETENSQAMVAYRDRVTQAGLPCDVAVTMGTPYSVIIDTAEDNVNVHPGMDTYGWETTHAAVWSWYSGGGVGTPGTPPGSPGAPTADSGRDDERGAALDVTAPRHPVMSWPGG